jgi:hypothetical protein
MNSTELSPSWGATSRSATQAIPNTKKPEGSLPCSQEPDTRPYHEPDQSSPYHPILLLC